MTVSMAKEEFQALVSTNEILQSLRKSKKIAKVDAIVLTITQKFRISDRRIEERIYRHQALFSEMIIDGGIIYWSQEQMQKYLSEQNNIPL